jgi:hypothetical protein
MELFESTYFNHVDSGGSHKGSVPSSATEAAQLEMDMMNKRQATNQQTSQNRQNRAQQRYKKAAEQVLSDKVSSFNFLQSS